MNIFKKIKLRHRVKKSVKEHINRPLDIAEILARKTTDNVVIDAYEFFMRKCEWDDITCFNKTVRNFLLSVGYDGYIANGGISCFLDSPYANDINAMINALQSIGCNQAANCLIRFAMLFPNGSIPWDGNERTKEIENISDKQIDELDIESYDIDISGFCYKYLINNKSDFLYYV